MTEAWGTCRKCGRRKRLRKNGVVTVHKEPKIHGCRGPRENCRGGGLQPTEAD